jgi:hypothetical protein
MSSHLSEEQFAKCLAGQGSNEVRQHLAECRECAAEVERFSKTITRFRYAVRDRVEARGPSKVQFAFRPAPAGFRIWRWASAAAVVVVLLSALYVNSSRQGPQQLVERESVETNPDALMRAVELHLSRTMPAPMEPVIALFPSDKSPDTPGGGVQ